MSGWIGSNYLSMTRLIKIAIIHIPDELNGKLTEFQQHKLELLIIIVQLFHSFTSRMMKPHIQESDIVMSHEQIKLFLSIVLRFSLMTDDNKESEQKNPTHRKTQEKGRGHQRIERILIKILQRRIPL